MAPVVIPGVNVPLLTGPLVLGYMFSYGLFGILIMQMYIYYINFPKDAKWIKYFVWSMFFLEFVFTIFTTIAAWNQYGLGWGDVDSLLIIDWSWIPLPALNGFIAGMVQTFYVWRIWNLTRNTMGIAVVCLIELVCALQVTVAFYYGIKVTVQGRGVDKLFALTPWITTWLISSAVCDVLITISIVTVLRRANNRTKFKKTTSAITRLIRFTVETGFATSVMAVVEAVLWLASHQYNIHFIGFLVLGKLYSNALVATLNSRANIFGDPGAYVSNQSSVPQSASAFWDDKGGTITSQSATLRSNTIHVSKTTDMQTDTEMIVVANGRGDGFDKPKYARDF